MHSMIVKREVLIGIVFRVIFLHEGTASDCDDCSDYLISGPRGISDDKLTASSTFRNDGRHLYDTKYSRLHFIKNENPVAGAWSAGTKDDQQYIQAEFPDVKFVKSIVTQGRANMDQWVTSYSVSYSIDGSIWSTIKDVNGITAIYPANNDRSTVVMNTLPDCLEAKYVRIHPKTWHSFVSLRFDVIGCSRLDTKISRNKMNWKRHPIMFSQEIKQNLTQVFETSTNNINVCAVKCQQNSLCLSFLLNQRSGTCIGFQEQAYEESTTSFSFLGDDTYFISLFQLDDYEYEFLESLNLHYKIFTWKATAHTASTKCKKTGARLLSIRSLDQMNTVQNIIENNLILSAQESHFYVDGSHRNGQWKYVIDTEIPTTLWSPSHPLSEKGDCVTLTLNGLETQNCMNSLYFICGM